MAGCLGMWAIAKNLVACNEILPDSRILTSDMVRSWRANYESEIGEDSLIVWSGIGWTPEWKCGTYPTLSGGHTQVSCMILRYLMGAGCNDGVVEFNSLYERNSNFNDKTYVISTIPTSWSGLDCSGNPWPWEVDHFNIKENSYLFYQYIEKAIKGDTSLHPRFIPKPFDIPITSPKEFVSRAYITALDTSLDIVLSIWTDSVALYTNRSVSVDFAESYYTLSGDGDNYLYVIAPYRYTGFSSIKVKKRRKDYEVETVDYQPVILFFLSRVSAYLRFNKSVYREHELIRMDLYHPYADSVIGIYWRDGDSSFVDAVRFTKVRDTFKAYLRIPESGKYWFLINTVGMEPRTILANIEVRRGYPDEDYRSRSNISEVYGDKVFVGGKGHYKIYDAKGSLVKSGIARDGWVSLKNFKKGIYFVVSKGAIFKVLRR